MKTETRIKIGDTVNLKSGSTEMSVVAFRADGQVVCAWFDRRDVVHRAAFPAEALVVG